MKVILKDIDNTIIETKYISQINKDTVYTLVFNGVIAELKYESTANRDTDYADLAARLLGA